jgi:hypothetical protein
MSDSSHDPPLPPEPETPMWLPALGAVLFFLAAVWFLAGSTSASAAAASAEDAGAAATAPAK